MTLRRIAWLFLIISLAVSIFGLVILGFTIPFGFPLTPIITLASITFAILHAGQHEGWIKALLFVLVVFATGLFFESLGVATGWVYGPYHYTEQLGPKFLGLVPWLIPVAWTFMVYPSMMIALALTPVRWTGLKRGLTVAALAGVIMTAWDVVMDPMMVYGGNWLWEVQGGYFGVPLQNFWGWWLTVFTAVSVYLLIIRKMPVKKSVIPEQWSVGMYILTGFNSIITCLLINLQGAALAGVFAMIPWMVMGWWGTTRRHLFN